MHLSWHCPPRQMIWPTQTHSSSLDKLILRVIAQLASLPRSIWWMQELMRLSSFKVQCTHWNLDTLVSSAALSYRSNRESLSVMRWQTKLSFSTRIPCTARTQQRWAFRTWPGLLTAFLSATFKGAFQTYPSRSLWRFSKKKENCWHTTRSIWPSTRTAWAQ